jgi:hypothetical protein
MEIHPRGDIDSDGSFDTCRMPSGCHILKVTSHPPSLFFWMPAAEWYVGTTAGIFYNSTETYSLQLVAFAAIFAIVHSVIHAITSFRFFSSCGGQVQRRKSYRYLLARLLIVILCLSVPEVVGHGSKGLVDGAALLEAFN